MKIIFQDIKKGEVKIRITTLEDLWYLSNIIDAGDEVSGRTFRKIKLGDDSDKNVKVIKKPVSLSIIAERVEFHKYSNSLRVSGKVSEGPEDVAKGSYHTFDLELDSQIRIFKKNWLQYQIQKLNEACEDTGYKTLIVAIERDNATYALLSSSGYQILSELEGEVGKKGYADTQDKEFFSDIAKNVQDYNLRYTPDNIILASPAFWKEDLFKIIQKKYPELTKKIVLATCNTTGKNAIEEILKRDEVKLVLKKDRTARESNLVEELLKEISKNANAAYGLKEVSDAAESHAIKTLLITDEYISKMREQNQYAKIDYIMKEVDHSQGEIYIVSTDHEAGKRLHGLGGIGAILRFKLN